MSLPQVSFGAASVREQLERILASASFAGSDRASAFLRYVVDQKLRHATASIKETTIGVDVFGKSADFDPKIDPVVRIYAGRVRERLDRYYENEGRGDALRTSSLIKDAICYNRAMTSRVTTGHCAGRT